MVAPGFAEVQLLDVLVPEHGGGGSAVEDGVVLAAAEDQVLGAHCKRSHCVAQHSACYIED